MSYLFGIDSSGFNEITCSVEKTDYDVLNEDILLNELGGITWLM